MSESHVQEHRGHVRPRGRRLAVTLAGLGLAVLVVTILALRTRLLEEWWLHELATGDDAEKCNAIHHLADTRSERAMPLLQQAIPPECRPQDRVALEAIVAMAELDRGSYEELQRALLRTSRSFQEAALDRVSKVGPGHRLAAARALLVLRASPEGYPVWLVDRCPCLLSDESLEAVRDSLSSHDTQVRLLALRLLATHGKAEWPSIRRALDDSSPWVRLETLRILDECAPDATTALAALRKAAGDPDGRARFAATQRLAKMQSPAAGTPQ